MRVKIGLVNIVVATRVYENYLLREITHVMSHFLEEFYFLTTDLAGSFESFSIFLLALVGAERTFILEIFFAESAVAIVPYIGVCFLVDRRTYRFKFWGTPKFEGQPAWTSQF